MKAKPTPVLLSLLALVAGSACTVNSRSPSTLSSTKATTSSTASATVVTGGAKAARIIFKATIDESGSFYPPSDNQGTAVTSGLQAQRVFDAAGNRLTTWPDWLTNVEIGLSGALNASSSNPNCARFADATDDLAATCTLNGTPNIGCGAPSSYYRISEFDCTHSGPAATATAVADGTVDTGVYIRATFNRDTAYLGTGENILAVLEYSAAALNAAPTDPSSCFSGGKFHPENCNDLLWQSYLKKSADESVEPFLMLIPPFPSLASISGIQGASVTTRQILIPLAGDPALKVFQLNRVKTKIANDAAFRAACAPNWAANGNAANSAQCAGAVFIAITFYRI